jgi:pyruvate/2-oxoglutarate dehydrogenase complex dihydrolipoamide acyltransferase (E2) component
MYFRIVMAAFLAALLHAGAAQAQSIKAGTTWVNQFESTLTIDTLDAESGALKGTYISRLGQYCTGTKHDAVGWVDGDRVVFSVRWKTSAADCKSITSWAGYVVNGKIVAFWDLVYVSPVDGSNFVHRGTDIFEPCQGGKPKGCPQQAAADQPRSSEQDAARAAAEQRARVAAGAKRKADEEAAARAAAEQRARVEAEARRKAEEEARVAEAGRIGVDARRLAEAGEAALNLSGRDRRRVQWALTSLGFDTQGIDERFGPQTRQMIAAWQKKQGAPDTGFLSAPQYAALQRQAERALAQSSTHVDVPLVRVSGPAVDPGP